jgi:hypothetical protein
MSSNLEIWEATVRELSAVCWIVLVQWEKLLCVPWQFPALSNCIFSLLLLVLWGMVSELPVIMVTIYCSCGLWFCLHLLHSRLQLQGHTKELDELLENFCNIVSVIWLCMYVHTYCKACLMWHKTNCLFYFCPALNLLLKNFWLFWILYLVSMEVNGK